MGLGLGLGFKPPRVASCSHKCTSRSPPSSCTCIAPRRASEAGTSSDRAPLSKLLLSRLALPCGDASLAAPTPMPGGAAPSGSRMHCHSLASSCCEKGGSGEPPPPPDSSSWLGEALRLGSGLGLRLELGSGVGVRVRVRVGAGAGVRVGVRAIQRGRLPVRIGVARPRRAPPLPRPPWLGFGFGLGLGLGSG